MEEELTPRQIAQRSRRERERNERENAQKAELEVAQETEIEPELQVTLEDPAPSDPAPLVDDPEASARTLLQEYQFREIEKIQRRIAQSAEAQKKENPKEAPAPTDPSDRWNIRLSNIPFVNGNLLLNSPTVNNALMGGAIKGVNNFMGAIDEAAAWLNENIHDMSKVNQQLFGSFSEEGEGIPKIPQVVEAGESMPEQFLEGVGEFLIGFIPFFAGIKAAQGAKTATGFISGFLQSETAGAMAGALMLDPMEDNLSNLINDSPLNFARVVTDFLAKAPDDSMAMRRTKDALEGMGLGAAAEGLVKVLGLMARARKSRGLDGMDPESYPEGTINVFSDMGDVNDSRLIIQEDRGEFIVDPLGGMPELVDDLTDEETMLRQFALEEWSELSSARDRGEALAAFRYNDETFTGPTHSDALQAAIEKYPEAARYTEELGDASEAFGFVRKPQVDEELINKWLSGDFSTSDLPFQFNWSRINTSEDLEQVVEFVSNMFTGRIDDARRNVITDQTLHSLAADLSLTPEGLINRVPGTVLNAEHVLGYKIILEASAQNLINMGRAAQNSMDPAKMYQMMRAMNLHVGMQAQFQGAASEAGRAFRAYQLPTGSVERQIQEIQEALMAGGGPC